MREPMDRRTREPMHIQIHSTLKPGLLCSSKCQPHQYWSVHIIFSDTEQEMRVFAIVFKQTIWKSIIESLKFSSGFCFFVVPALLLSLICNPLLFHSSIHPSPSFLLEKPLLLQNTISPCLFIAAHLLRTTLMYISLPLQKRDESSATQQNVKADASVPACA